MVQNSHLHVHAPLKTKTSHFGSNTCFWRWFHNRSVSFFGQKTQEHVKTIKKGCLEAKHDIFAKMHFESKFSFNFARFGSKTYCLIFFSSTYLSGRGPYPDELPGTSFMASLVLHSQSNGRGAGSSRRIIPESPIFISARSCCSPEDYTLSATASQPATTP